MSTAVCPANALVTTGRLIYPSYIWVDSPISDVTIGQVQKWIDMAHRSL